MSTDAWVEGEDEMWCSLTPREVCKVLQCFNNEKRKNTKIYLSHQLDWYDVYIWEMWSCMIPSHDLQPGEAICEFSQTFKEDGLMKNSKQALRVIGLRSVWWKHHDAFMTYTPLRNGGEVYHNMWPYYICFQRPLDKEVREWVLVSSPCKSNLDQFVPYVTFDYDIRQRLNDHFLACFLLQWIIWP